jgi:hypothetical protein
MKIALVRSVHVTGAQCFGWTWCAEDGKAQSRRTFVYFFECCEDARNKGYQCRFDGSKTDVMKEHGTDGRPLPAGRRSERAA